MAKIANVVGGLLDVLVVGMFGRLFMCLLGFPCCFPGQFGSLRFPHLILSTIMTLMGEV